MWLGAGISNIGNWMENVAQGWAVVRDAKDAAQSAFLIEILNFADFLPVIFLALLAGVISDRVNRKAWLFTLQASACVLGTALAAVGFLGYLTPGVVIGLTFAEGIVWALNGPVWLSVLPSLVPRAEIQNAMAASSLQFNLARLIGPVIAGAIIGAFGVNVAFAVNAVTFVPVLLAVLSLPPQPERSGEGSAPVLEDLKEGLRFVWGHKGTRRLAVMSATFMFLSAPLQGLLATFAKEVLGGDSRLFGFMLGAIGLGAVIIGRMPGYYPRHHLIPLAMCAYCAFALAYSYSNTIWLSLVLLFFCGIALMLTLNTTNTANQLLATDENRGRVVSVMLLCNQGAMPLGHLFAGALASVLAPQAIVRAMIGALFVLAACFLFFREPAIDGLERRALKRNTMIQAVAEAITAESHRPPDALGDSPNAPSAASEE